MTGDMNSFTCRFTSLSSHFLLECWELPSWESPIKLGLELVIRNSGIEEGLPKKIEANPAGTRRYWELRYPSFEDITWYNQIKH